MAELIINRIQEGLFTHELDGIQSAIDNRPNLTSFTNVSDGQAVMHFKTKNGAPLVKDQEITPQEITITDTFGGTPNQTGFTNPVQVWLALGNLGYFEGFAGSSGGAGIDTFKNLLDVYPNSFQYKNGMVYVVDEANNRLIPVEFFNFSLITQFKDVESTQAQDIPNGYVLTSVTVLDENGVARKMFGFRPQAIMSQTPNGFLTLGTFSLVDGVFTATTGYTWSYNGVEYGNLENFTYTIDTLPEGSSRYIVFETVPNSNEFTAKLGEISTDGNAAKPQPTLGAEELTFVLVDGDEVTEEGGNPILGAPYVTKISQSFIDYTANNADNGILFDSLNGRSKFALTSATPYVVPAYVLDTSNLSTVSLATDMPVVFYNLGAGHIFKHNDTSIDFGMPFIFPDGQNFTAVQGSVISFLPRNGQLIFDNYSQSEIVNLDNALTNGNTTDKDAVFTNGTQYVKIFSNGYIQVRDNSANGNKIIQIGSSPGNPNAFSILSGTNRDKDMFHIISGGSDEVGHARFGNGNNYFEMFADTNGIGTNQLISYIGSAPTTMAGRNLIDANFFNVGLALKANDSDVLHKSGLETILDDKTIASGKSLYLFSNNYGIGTPDGMGFQQFFGAGDNWRLGTRSAGVFTEILKVASSGLFFLGRFTTGTEPAYQNGGMYFNTSINRIKFGGATGWEILAPDTLTAPDGNKWRLSVSNTGVLTTTPA